MSDDPSSEALLVRYLLGDLPDQQQAEIEDRAFSDPEYLRNIQAVESDLIDEYVRGALSQSDHRRFEQRFLASAERRRKVDFAKALAAVTPEFAANSGSVAQAPKLAVSPVSAGEAPELGASPRSGAKAIELAVSPGSAAEGPELGVSAGSGAEAGNRRRVAPTPLPWRPALVSVLRGFSAPARYALAAGAALVVLGASWLVVDSIRLRSQLGRLSAAEQSAERRQQVLEQQLATEQGRGDDLTKQLQSEHEQREHSEQLVGELQHELEQSPTQPPQSTIASLMLLPGLARSGGTRPKLVIPGSARQVRIQVGIDPEDDYKSFSVDLHGPSGQSIWTQSSLPARHIRGGRAITLTLPATLLQPGQYELALKGLIPGGNPEDLAFHYFEVAKK
jgi:anti-sigma factor RsiW